MPQPSPATEIDARAFCDLCQWVYECWLTHSHLFQRLPARLEQDRNIPVAEFLETPFGRCMGRLNDISQHYSILQIAKLHDPARQGVNENLSIDFFVGQELWSEDEMPIVAGIASELDNLYRKIHDVRNKILAHNDRAVFADDESLGSFPEGDDEVYFDALGRLCTLIWGKFPDKNWPHGHRIFDFTKSGIEGDPLCPSTDARELCELVLRAFPKMADDADPA